MIKNIIKSYVTVVVTGFALMLVGVMAYMDYLLLFDGGYFIEELDFMNNTIGFASFISVTAVIMLLDVTGTFTILKTMWKTK